MIISIPIYFMLREKLLDYFVVNSQYDVTSELITQRNQKRFVKYFTVSDETPRVVIPMGILFFTIF